MNFFQKDVRAEHSVTRVCTIFSTKSIEILHLKDIPMKQASAKRVVATAIAFLPLSLLATQSSGAAPQPVNVVGYSIVANAYTALEKAFVKTGPGQGVT